ncbi:MAG: DNA translocase FtsK [Spirochaetales bacterium]
MKRFERYMIIIGIFSLALSAIFMLSFIVQLFYFGANNTVNASVLFTLGHMVMSVYGFSSLLIPVFFFVAGILMFLPNWTDRKGIFLLASIFPFLTVVAVEFFTDFLFQGDSFTVLIIKITAFLCISALLCAIEYIIIGLFSDLILHVKTKKITPVAESTPYTTIVLRDNDEEEVADDVDENATEDVFNEPEYCENENENQIEEEQNTENENPPLYDDSENSDAEYKAANEAADDSLAEKSLPIPELDTGTQGAYLPLIHLHDDDDDVNCGDFEDFPEENNEETIESAIRTAQNIDLDSESSENFEATGFSSAVINLTDEEDIEDNMDFADDDEYDEKPEEEYSDFADDNDCDCDDDSDELNDDVLDNSLPTEKDDEELSNDSFGFFGTQPEYEFKSQPVEKIEQVEESALPVSIEPSSSAEKKHKKVYSVPTEGILTTCSQSEYWIIDEQTQRAGRTLEETLNEFKIEAKVTGIRKGPVVTMYEILPASGVKLSKIVALGDNIALRLAASSVRIVAPIPGKHAVGIEVPNAKRAIVSFKELIESDLSAFNKMAIPVILGKDIAGDSKVLDLAKTPHLLIAGATGAGKSVCVNTMILSILYKRSPQDVKMILIDPKMVELKLYNDIPHLLTPVITEPKKAFQALQYCLCEMERRYALLDGMGVRDINGYNQRIKERNIATEKLPYIVLVIDEFADLMATTGKELESTVARLAAMSRAIGIHLVLATQRPSIDVITGLIKANIPSRIAFMVASKTDSRIIIDQMGAEKLLGKGDMLYAGVVSPFPVRVQGTFVSDDEVERVVEFVKQYGEPDYIDDEIFVDEDESFDATAFSGDEDPLYEDALEIVMQSGKASASYIQRRLKIGYNRAARLVEDMEMRGIVGPANGSKPREVLHVV